MVRKEETIGENLVEWLKKKEKTPREANKITDATNAPVSDLMFVPYGTTFAMSSLKLICIQWYREKQENKCDRERERNKKTRHKEREEKKVRK